MKVTSLVIDTSIFVNPDSGRNFGHSPTHALTSFLKMIESTKSVQLFMPPSIYKELQHFIEESKVPKKLLLLINRKSPGRHEIQVPGYFIYKLVDNMRDRIDRGLRLAERHVREALHVDPPKKADKNSNQAVRPDAEAVGRLRENYRRIMREGLLDSSADVDLLLLAYEMNATLVSADQGLLDWADELGLHVLSHEMLRDFVSGKISA